MTCLSSFCNEEAARGTEVRDLWERVKEHVASESRKFGLEAQARTTGCGLKGPPLPGDCASPRSSGSPGWPSLLPEPRGVRGSAGGRFRRRLPGGAAWGPAREPVRHREGCEAGSASPHCQTPGAIRGSLSKHGAGPGRSACQAAAGRRGPKGRQPRLLLSRRRRRPPRRGAHAERPARPHLRVSWGPLGLHQGCVPGGTGASGGGVLRAPGDSNVQPRCDPPG